MYLGSNHVGLNLLYSGGHMFEEKCQRSVNVLIGPCAFCKYAEGLASARLGCN